MKTRIVLLGLIAGAIGARGQDRGYTATADVTYASDYVFRGVEQADDSIQPSAEFSCRHAYLGVWINQPLRNREHDEVDLYGGYRYKLNRSFSVEAVGTYYDYPQAKGFETRRTYEAGVGATCTVRGIALSAYYYRDFKLNADTEQASVNYSVPLTFWGTSLDFNGFLGTVQSANWLPYAPTTSRQSYNYYGLNVSLPYKVGAKTDVALGVHWAHNDGLPRDYSNDHIWWSMGVTVAF